VAARPFSGGSYGHGGDSLDLVIGDVTDFLNVVVALGFGGKTVVTLCVSLECCCGVRVCW
jgi:hypothetical protein